MIFLRGNDCFDHLNCPEKSTQEGTVGDVKIKMQKTLGAQNYKKN